MVLFYQYIQSILTKILFQAITIYKINEKEHTKIKRF